MKIPEMVVILILFVLKVYNYSADNKSNSLEGIVYEVATGKPILGAVIYTSDGYTAMSTVNGNFQIKAIKKESFDLNCYATGYEPYQKKMDIIDSTTIVAVGMKKKIENDTSIHTRSKNTIIIGSIHDSLSGNPIPEVKIFVFPEDATLISDENGLFSFMTQKECNHSLILFANGYNNKSVEIVKHSDNFINSFSVPLVPTVPPLDTSGSLTVHVFNNKNNAPIKNAALVLLGTEFAGVTDSNGVTVFPIIPPGTYMINIFKRDFKSKMLQCGIRAEENKVFEVNLDEKMPSPYATVTGFVTDSKGKNLDSVTFSIDGKSTTTDSSGRFSIDSINSGVVSCTVYKKKYIPLYDRITVYSNQESFLTYTLQDSIMENYQNSKVRLMRNTISGTVINEKNNEPVAGAKVELPEKKHTTLTDLFGNFILTDLSVAHYSLLVSLTGYDDYRMDSISFNKDSIINLKIVMKQADYYELQKITVASNRLKNTTGSLIEQRKKALTINDGVAAEEMSKVNASNAADAIKLVTGVTLVDGRYPIIRGLSERYNMTLLNGVELPSPDPDRRAVALDLFPSNLLDNIEVRKTFSAENWGNFSGGIVNIITKNFPDKRSISLALKTGYNPNTTFKKDFLSDEGGSLDWLGIDDGTRAIPVEVDQRSPWTPSEIQITRIQRSSLPDSIKADTINKIIKRIDQVAQAFKNDFEPEKKTAIPDIGGSVSYGETFYFDNLKIGTFLSLTYDNKNAIYREGTEAEWVQKTHYDSSSTTLDSNIINKFQSSKNEILWGTLGKTGVSFNDNHKIDITALFTCNTDQSAREIVSSYDEQIRDEGSQFVKKEIKYLERRLFFSLIHGNHTFLTDDAVSFNWNLGFTNSFFNEPDIRTFMYYRNEKLARPEYAFMTGTYDPEHLFRKITEKAVNVDIACTFSTPLNLFTQAPLSITAGSAYQRKIRDYYQNKFKVLYSFPSQDLQDCRGNFDCYTDEINMGIVPTKEGKTDSIGNQIIKTGIEADTNNNYIGYQNILAGFCSFSLPITDWVMLTAGLRYEDMTLDLKSWNPDDTNTNLTKNNAVLLPSFSSIFSIKNSKLRFNYGRTYAKPVFREMTHSQLIDISLKSVETGNVIVTNSDIHNFDVRYEWFFKPGELASISGFYKFINNPITKNFVNSESKIIQIVNQKYAKAIGLEIEARKNFDFIHPALEDLSFSGNVTLLNTETKTDGLKAKWLQLYYNDPDLTIPLAGASPYVINTALHYENKNLQFSTAVYFNIFGKSLDYISCISPDVYQYPYPLLNATTEKTIGSHINIKIGMKNLLNSKVREGLNFKGTDYFRRINKSGCSFSLSLNYKF